jgi:Fur family ferric uptake transcriptional regulator
MRLMNSDAILKNLKKKGFKSTLLRRKLIDIFLSKNFPISVPEILDLLRLENLEVNKTSVYREIEFLIDQQLIRQIDLRERGKRYEFDLRNHHHHLICIKCNLIEDFELDQDLDVTEKKIKEAKNFTVLNHSLEFFGICKNCSTKRA